MLEMITKHHATFHHSFHSSTSYMSTLVPPPDAQTAQGQRQRPGIQTAWVVPDPGTTHTKSHIIRTGTANTRLMHQTALSYDAAVPDGGRLAPKNAP